MYEVKPFTGFVNIPVPTCAYKLKNVQNSGNIDLSTKQKGRLIQPCALDMDLLSKHIQILNNKSCGDIVQRQAAVLHKLEVLQNLLAKKMNSFNLGSGKAVETVNESSLEQLPEVIISANPNNIPYTLQVLQYLWQDKIQLHFKFYKHSSLSDLPKNAQLLEKQLQNHVCNSASLSMKVTLIWMECDQTEFLSSSILHAPIYGEVNMLRYLIRIGPHALRYENLREASQIDSFLDFCHLLMCSKLNDMNSRDLSNLLAQYIKDNEFLFGKHISIADIYLFSVVKQKLKPNLNAKEMPVKFNAWWKRMQDTFK